MHRYADILSSIRFITYSENLGRYIQAHNPNYKEVKGDPCPICLNPFERLKKVYEVIACGHKFHSHCLLRWIKTGENCPLCRTKIKDSEEDAIKRMQSSSGGSDGS